MNFLSLNVNSVNESSFVGFMHSFAGMVHNEDTTWSIDLIPSRLDEMSIFPNFI